ncbi:MAG: hypothetical protein ACRDPY_34885 [Streptosporangiaceae bacterium]
MNSFTGGHRPAAIAVTGLRKSFGDKVVLDGIDLAVPEGTIFALLGPNGVGKANQRLRHFFCPRYGLAGVTRFSGQRDDGQPWNNLGTFRYPAARGRVCRHPQRLWRAGRHR